MSFLRKRSRSQCSFSKGDEEITVRRIQQSDFNRQSRADTFTSTRSSLEVGASDFDVHDSCVIRNFPKHKSSHLRFLAWVAYTRKYTDEWIMEDERRTCPLLWCRTVFKDQEEMLKHVWNCEHLSKGLYWCFHCQKPERVGKFQCKRCQGLPSRTDRMASVAKKIFSRLGAKPNHAEFVPPEPEVQKGLSKIAEDSVTSYPYDPSSFEGISHSYDDDQAVDWDHQLPQELPNTSVCRELPGDWTAAAHELADTFISEMQGTECPIELGVGSEDWTDNFYASSLEEWDIPSTTSKVKNASPKLARIDTSFTHLNSHVTPETQMEMSPQKYSSHSWEAAFQENIISPLSASGGPDYNTFEVSPTDTEASGNSFFTDSGYSTATTMSAWSTSATRFADPESLQGLGGKKQSRPFGTIPDDWMNNIAPSRPQALSLMPASVPQMSTEMLRSISSASRYSVSEKPVLVSANWSDAGSLVQYFSEILETHIQHTKSSLKQLPSSAMITELLALSRTSMASIGLDALVAALEGRKPNSVVQIFSLAHVAYAFAIAVDYSNVQEQQWFHDSLAWAEELGSERSRQMYHDIARSIWQPLDIFAEDVPYQAAQSSNVENLLLSACKHFLDVFESFSTPKNVPSLPPSNGFDFAQELFQSRCKTRVIDELLRNQSIKAFNGGVVTIGRRLQDGKITNTRQLELELICVGKLASQPLQAFTIFARHVTHLCDSLYREEAGTLKSRAAHQIQDIALIKQHLPEEHFFEEHEEDDYGHDERHNHEHDDIGDLLDLDFDAKSEDIEACINAFKDDADNTLSHIDVNFTIQTASSTHINERSPFVQTFGSVYQHSTSSFQQQQIPQTPASTPQSSLPPTSPVPSSNKYRCHCGYSPSGEERWKASNLRRHKRTQHPTEVKVHRCEYPGCKSVFTRSDNLRSHRRDKGHFLGFEGEPFPGDGMEGMGNLEGMRGPKRRRGGD
ncbi:hypothetical protein L207DRAFT_535229 [Hyaloscypha variabilis F]|uniref:C2H2-type domain-containing protein n=1 Tax=Hyaloscypha variabilis (strain UAMH 11265 / GT02V1 / F) TaxID=1149755 RepID=A0A2J6R3T7_HYAVF|nr:hypothetical protein L207DRAFT_535229 [Hyaloscypha variabilis F]